MRLGSSRRDYKMSKFPVPRSTTGPKSLPRPPSEALHLDARAVRAPRGGGLAQRAAALRAQLETYARIAPSLAHGVEGLRAHGLPAGQSKERAKSAISDEQDNVSVLALRVERRAARARDPLLGWYGRCPGVSRVPDARLEKPPV